MEGLKPGRAPHELATHAPVNQASTDEAQATTAEAPVNQASTGGESAPSASD